MNSLTLPPVIPARLRQYERGRKLMAVARGCAEVVLVFCGGLLAVALLEWVFRPQLPGRRWLSAINYAVAAGFFLYRVIWPLSHRRNLRAVAAGFERAANAHYHERILAAVEMADTPPESQPGVSAWMMQRTIDLAAEEIRAADPGLLVNRAPAVKAWKSAAASVLVLALACLSPGFVHRLWLALNPGAPTAPIARIHLAVRPGDCRVSQGAPLEITASGPNLPDEVKALIRWDDGFHEAVSMSRAGTNEFSLALPGVSQGFRYSVQAGDAESGTFSVKVDAPPRIARLQLAIEPPTYTHWTNRIVEGGSADFLIGSRVRLLLETAEEKVTEAEWIADTPMVRQFQSDNARLALDLQLTNPVTYQLRLTGANKLQSLSAQKWTLRPVADEPPAAKLAAVGAEPGMVQRDEVLPLQSIATDDVGLKRVDLVALTKDAEADLKPLYALDKGIPARELTTPFNYNLAELNTGTGDEVQLQLVATDLRDQTTRSEPLAFTIGASDKAFEAQLAARLKLLVSAVGAQSDYLQQTRASWLSIGRNYKDDDPAAQRPALAVLKSRLNEFGREIGAIGDSLVFESETNACSGARFMYRFGSTVTAWGNQQRDVLLSNCALLEQAKGTNIYEAFNLGRDLFSRSLVDLDQFKRVLTILQGVFETDVLAGRCEGAQGRYKRGLPVLRGENIIAPLGRSGSGLLATFFDGATLNGRVLEQKVDNPRFDNYAPGGRGENWSARYEGEINVVDPGDWVLACVADDGVRLAVDGKSILPAGAWGLHAATEFKGELKLASGWHPVTIEFYQASSLSKLQFLAGKQGAPLQEVPLAWLRPPPGRAPSPELATNLVLSAIVKDALKDRVKNSLSIPSSVPPAVAPFTNVVRNDTLGALVRQKSDTALTLTTNLQRFASWKPEQSQQAEAQADELTALSKDAQRILREELEKHRWQYEGAAALKEIQNAIQELREVNQELRQLPWHNKPARTEPEQAKIEVEKAWQKELRRATAEAAHQLFETAKQKDATLAERATALQATTKVEKELQPAVEKLAATLRENGSKDEMANHVDQQLNDISNRYRELNDLQEKINREQVAADARKALPVARAFERAQKAQAGASAQEKHDRLKDSVAEVVKAQRVAGAYDEARKLEDLAGDSPRDAKGHETAQFLRDLARRTDRNIPSLGQTIPPPMREDAQALREQKAAPSEAANDLAKPRLAMALESSRLVQQGDRPTAVAYGILGEDLGALIEAPVKLNADSLQPLADRAAALAGEKGEEARQAEIRNALERARRLAAEQPDNPDSLAGRLDEMSVMAKQAAGQPAQRRPLGDQLGQMSKLAPAVPNWAESTDPKEIAASAASESADEIEAAPQQWESYNNASQMLSDAASQLRMQNAVSELADANPYPVPQEGTQEGEPAMAASADKEGSLEGPAGTAITQPPPKGIDQAEWARLNERLRQAIRSSGIENFSEEHQAAIRAYFERLSTDSQKNGAK
ncbi:MAG TPA: PA14 domain-containing protein [Verrucomicrobiae bacterium]